MTTYLIRGYRGTFCTHFFSVSRNAKKHLIQGGFDKVYVLTHDGKRVLSICEDFQEFGIRYLMPANIFDR